MLKDRVIIVTGASAGLGLEVARLALREGARVLATGRSEERLAAARDDLLAGLGPDGADRLATIVADVTSEEAVGRSWQLAIERFGMPDGVVNNAGVTLIRRVGDTTLEDWRDLVDVHATGTFLMCREAVRRWAEGRVPGAIVNVSSVSGKGGAPMASAYGAAKAAVLGFTRSLAREVAGAGIRVNCVCPGAMDTAMFHEGTVAALARMLGADPAALMKATLAMIPQRRLLNPSEVAEMVIFLLSRRASAITGQSVNVDGGYDTH